MRIKVVIDGVSGTPLSYAIVNDAQMAAMRKHGGFEIRTAADYAVDKSFDPHVAYRIKLPLRFDQIAHLPTFVFVTCEAGFGPEAATALKKGCRNKAVEIIVPSTFARDILLRFGAEPEKVFIVPHGVDTAVFRPSPVAVRENCFTYLHVSTLEHRKGTDILLRAFAHVAERRDVRLILKGVDQLYPSRRLAAHWITTLNQAERRAVEGKIRYIGETLTSHQMADLYRSADCLVQPYRAESFCLPALEGLACGLPVLCTGGGPTDGFIEGQIAHKIEARLVPFGADGQQMIFEPDPANLAALMIDEYEMAPRRKHQVEGAVRCLGWDDVAVQLYDLFARHV